VPRAPQVQVATCAAVGSTKEQGLAILHAWYACWDVQHVFQQLTVPHAILAST
jgi:hypothetical protein